MEAWGRRSGRVRAVSLAWVVVLTSLAAGQEDASLRAYYTGNGLLQRGLYDLAIPEYRTFLDEHPTHEKAPIARYGLGVSLFRLDRLPEAAHQLDLILDDDDFQFASESLLLRGHCHMSAGEYERAGEMFERLLNRHGSHASAGDAAALLAEARYRAGRLDRVDEAIAYLIANHPDNARRDRAELLGGLAAMGREDLAAAASRFEALLKRNARGKYADQASLLLAQSLHRLDLLDQADAWYRDAMGREGSAFAPDARLGLAHLTYARGELERSRALLDETLRSGEPKLRQAEASLLRARVALDEGDLERAERILTPLRRDEGEGIAWRDDATYWLAKAALRREDPEAASALLGEFAERFEGSELMAEAMFDRGVALQRAGEKEAALSAYEAFGERFGDHGLAPASLRARASLAHELGQYDGSLALCEEYLTRHAGTPEAPEIAFLAAENDFLAGRHGPAAERYASLLREIDGGTNEGALSERAAYRLGMSLARLDRFDEARPLLERVTDGDRTKEVFLPALFALGEGLFARSQWRESEAAFEAYVAAAQSEVQLLDDALIRVGLARLRLNEGERAIEALATLLARFPDSTHALQAMFEIAQAEVSLGRDAEAEAMFLRVLEAEPESRFAPFSLEHLGAIAMADGRFDVAAARFERLALLRGDRTSDALLRQGRALLAGGDFQAALDTLDRAIDAADSGGEVGLRARAYRAVALARLDRAQEAEPEIMALLGGDGLGDELVRSLRYERAWCLRGLGRSDEAIAAYAELLVDQPRDATRAHALLDLAGLEMDAGQHERAIMPLEESLAIAREQGVDLIAQGEYRLGVARFRVGQSAEASEILATFGDRHPQSELRASAGLIAGEALYQLGRFERASEVLSRVSEEHTHDASAGPALLRLGECEAALQRWARSEEVFARYLERYGASELAFQARFGLAWARENLGRYDDAIASYREVIETHRGPTAARAQFQVGECLFAKKLYAEAVTEFLRVDILYSVPEWTAAALYEAGRCFETMSKIGEAREQYAQVVDRFAESDWARLSSERLDAISGGARRGG